MLHDFPIFLKFIEEEGGGGEILFHAPFWSLNRTPIPLNGCLFRARPGVRPLSNTHRDVQIRTESLASN